MTPTTVIIGDIGGHLSVLETILRQLDVSEDGSLPDGLQVIQVGDLVRAAPQFRDRNRDIMRRMDVVLRANGPDRWVQLLGNHECAALGGPAKADWSTEDAFEDECAATLRKLWTSGRIVLATALHETLITHAGLTLGRWESMGSPSTASQAAEMINRNVGTGLASFSVPGSLVTGRRVDNADTMWAEVNMELLGPWLAHGNPPFSQVHGHAAPFHWNAGDWWPEASDSVRQATEADSSIRRSVTSFAGNSNTITSVDWTLESAPPTQLWPLLCFNETEISCSMKEIPDLWDGPGVLFGVSRANGMDAYAQIDGPRARIAVWERRWTDSGRSFLPSIRTLSSGNENIAQELHQSKNGDGFAFELDLSWNNDVEKRIAWQILQERLPPAIYSLILSLPEIDPTSVNTNRSIYPNRSFKELNATVLDLPINTLPSTRQRSRRLTAATRWVRVILTDNGLVALWHPCDQGWEPDHVPWPHNAIPSRTSEHLHSIRNEHVSAEERQRRWLTDTVNHEEYFIDSWFTELEFWQNESFQWLTGELTLSDVDRLRADLGVLSAYLNSVRWTQRAFKRRADMDHSPNTERALHLTSSATSLDERLIDSRQWLKESFDVLATVSQRVQEDAANRAKESSERLNWLITLFTAVLFVPTVVSGIYGANIDALAEGAKGSLPQLVSLMVGLALASFGLLSMVPKRWAECGLGVSCGLATVLIFELTSLVQNSAVSLLWASIPSLLFLCGMLVINANRRSQ